MPLSFAIRKVPYLLRQKLVIDAELPIPALAAWNHIFCGRRERQLLFFGDTGIFKRTLVIEPKSTVRSNNGNTLIHVIEGQLDKGRLAVEFGTY